MFVVWVGYWFKGRSPWFFTSSNPTLTFGGFEGEGKKEMYEQLPPGCYPSTFYVQPGTSIAALLAQLDRSRIRFPLLVKPDVGMKGLLVRKINTSAQLIAYHRRCPVAYLVQEWVDYPLELAVFYYRYPGQAQGVVSGISAKSLLWVTGDGNRTLQALIYALHLSKGQKRKLMHKHKAHLGAVLASGERYQLTVAANRGWGTPMSNLKHEIDPTITAVMDQLSMHAQHFYWGRFDIKCASLSDFKLGRHFKVLEFNGAGAAPSHIYQSGLSFGEAWAEVAANWKALYEISTINHQNGFKRWSFWRGLKFTVQSRLHFRKIKRLEHEI